MTVLFFKEVVYISFLQTAEFIVYFVAVIVRTLSLRALKDIPPDWAAMALPDYERDFPGATHPAQLRENRQHMHNTAVRSNVSLAVAVLSGMAMVFNMVTLNPLKSILAGMSPLAENDFGLYQTAITFALIHFAAVGIARTYYDSVS